MMMVEYPIKGVFNFTEEIKWNGIVFSFPPNKPGTFKVIPIGSIIILAGNNLFPSDNLEASNYII